ncbi:MULTISPECIES: hypothetical protein [unclassified Acinetobacter]|uniref:hypothetical protein n=1 Tax=unclassified Acinetobacter TaxID=196816 RepID=UPI0015D3F98D|nr:MULTISPECIES: hypothetical protein [unclassified Acinetobacter]
MKKITELKIKQKQSLNLSNFIDDTKQQFVFLNDSYKFSICESINFYSEILLLKKRNQMLIEANETQDTILINKKMNIFIQNLPNSDFLFDVSFSQYETFFEEGEYFNISPLPVFKLNKNNIKKLYNYFSNTNLSFFAIISAEYKLVLDSYAGNTNSSEPDLPTYEYYEELPNKT